MSPMSMEAASGSPSSEDVPTTWRESTGLVPTSPTSMCRPVWGLTVAGQRRNRTGLRSPPHHPDMRGFKNGRDGVGRSGLGGVVLLAGSFSQNALDPLQRSEVGF